MNLRILPPILLLALAPMCLPRAARAQVDLSFDTLQIGLWPEFDQPSMLVILDARLTAGAPLPAQIAIRIPASAGKPLAVAARDANGSFLNTPFTTKTEGDWLVVTATAANPDIRVEYYDPALRVNGTTRSYQLDWVSDYAVTAAKIRVQQPVGASGLTGTPPLASLGAGEYDLAYFGADLGALKPGQVVSFSLTYTKAGDALSADTVSPPEFAATPDLPVEPSSNPSLNLWVVGAGAAGAALIGGGVYWYLQSRRAPAESPKRRRRKRSAGQASAPERETDRVPETRGARFCHECGNPIVAGDVYCRNCGTRVRG
ncbi:MAG: zinc ribbon domain-containing protein [Chloroflexi bacterium]|nr:zinc ribbon domain-containing protein [Chloroflexota bacterium]